MEVSQIETIDPQSVNQIENPEPKWEVPKAHRKAQKQRIDKAAKAAKEAKEAARKSQEQKAAREAIIAALKEKTAVSFKHGSRDQDQTQSGQPPRISDEERCWQCPIRAPHRIGIYHYESPDLPKKILIIQAKVLRGTATPQDLMLQNGFAAVHTNYAHVPIPVEDLPADQQKADNGTNTVFRRHRTPRSQNRHCKNPN